MTTLPTTRYYVKGSPHTIKKSWMKVHPHTLPGMEMKKGMRWILGGAIRNFSLLCRLWQQQRAPLMLFFFPTGWSSWIMSSAQNNKKTKTTWAQVHMEWSFQLPIEAFWEPENPLRCPGANDTKANLSHLLSLVKYGHGFTQGSKSFMPTGSSEQLIGPTWFALQLDKVHWQVLYRINLHLPLHFKPL